MTAFDLGDAILERTVFSGANLRGSRFCGTRMMGTNFSQANLVGVDFTKVKFSNANLAGADLTHAKLDGADLRDAKLSGARLAGTEPWEAKLYNWDPRKTSEMKKTTSCKSIDSVADLVRECKAIQSGDSDVILYFRGENIIRGADGEQKLQPSVMRCPKLRNKESKMLSKLMSRRPEDFSGGQSAFSQWVLAQHHGLKTRFLDVTRNPLVGLFFACHTTDKKSSADEDGRLHVFRVPHQLVKPFNSDTVRVISNFAKLPWAEQRHILGYRDPGSGANDVNTDEAMQRLYDFIREEKPAFAEKIDPKDFYQVFIVEPQHLFERIRAQSGAFLVSAFHERFERDQVLEWNESIPVYDYLTFTVRKKKILKELQLMNVTRESLFPTLDETARAIVDELRNSHS